MNIKRYPQIKAVGFKVVLPYHSSYLLVLIPILSLKMAPIIKLSRDRRVKSERQMCSKQGVFYMSESGIHGS